MARQCRPCRRAGCSDPPHRERHRNFKRFLGPEKLHVATYLHQPRHILFPLVPHAPPLHFTRDAREGFALLPWGFLAPAGQMVGAELFSSLSNTNRSSLPPILDPCWRWSTPGQPLKFFDQLATVYPPLEGENTVYTPLEQVLDLVGHSGLIRHDPD